MTMIALSSMILGSFDSFKGWPSANKVCDISILWTKVVNPSTTVQEGMIYVLGKSLDTEEKTWYSDFFYSYTGADAPRLYSFPYNEKNKGVFTNVIVELNHANILKLTCKGATEDEQKTRKTKSGQFVDGTNNFKVEAVNPMELLPKPNN